MRVLSFALPLVVAASAAFSGPISFDGNWNEQRLQLFNSNDYGFNGNRLSIESEGAVSLAWSRTGEANWGATSATWSWAVDQSVPVTDLSRKGGDDRNISVYFVFLPQADAERLKGAGIRRLSGNDNVRILQYVWGGDEARGLVEASPYAPEQSANVFMRQAGTGRHSESVNLAADYARAFGGAPEALVGVAVSADSDDTDAPIVASVSNFAIN